MYMIPFQDLFWAGTRRFKFSQNVSEQHSPKKLFVENGTIFAEKEVFFSLTIYLKPIVTYSNAPLSKLN